MGHLDEPAFQRSIDKCSACEGISFEIAAYLDRTVSVMLGDANGDGKWAYDGEKFIDGVYRVRCVACSADAFTSPDCPRCHRAGALADALAATSRLAVPKRCPKCKNTEVTLVGFAPSTSRTTDASARPTTPVPTALFGDPGFHVVAVACDACDWAEVAEGCPIAARPRRCACDRSTVRGMKKLLLALVCVAPAIASAEPAQAQKKAPPPAKVTVKLADAKGKAIGTATLSAADKGVKIDLDLTGLPPGEHAIHVHEAAKCEGPDFKTAGGHFNPDKKHHGMQGAGGPHAGDMPNFTVDAKGNAKTSVTAPGVTLDAGDAHSVFTGGGTALVIHEKADDMKSDPSGNAGARIACGVIKP